jgi:hypothetical protein
LREQVERAGRLGARPSQRGHEVAVAGAGVWRRERTGESASHSALAVMPEPNDEIAWPAHNLRKSDRRHKPVRRASIDPQC